MIDPGRPATWRVEHHLGSAAAFHDRDLPDPVRRVVWWFEVTRPAVALGSTQSLDVVDHDAAAAAGVEVLRRRSGGGAVWLAPGGVTWVDVVVPAADPRWVDDVGRAAIWLGQTWVAALAALGIEGASLHDGPIVASAHSALVCFAGLAPGEVTVGGRKTVGISQRRTRGGARFQCAVLHHWDPRPLVDVLAVPDNGLGPGGFRAHLSADLADLATGIGPVDSSTLVDALLTELNANP